MFKNYAFMLTAIILFASSAFADVITGICNQVVDANTLMVTANGNEYTVQLAYIDAPVIGQKFGAEAKQFVESLTLNQKLKIIAVNTNDNVITAEVYSSKKQDSINQELVRKGLAWPIIDNDKRHPYDLSMSLAKKRLLGVWSDPSLKPPVKSAVATGIKGSVKGNVIGSNSNSISAEQWQATQSPTAGHRQQQQEQESKRATEVSKAQAAQASAEQAANSAATKGQRDSMQGQMDGLQGQMAGQQAQMQSEMQRQQAEMQAAMARQQAEQTYRNMGGR